MIKNKNKKIKIILTVLILSASSCATVPAVKEGFNFTDYERIGVVEFVSYGFFPESGASVSDEFIRHLIKSGINVVDIKRPSRETPESYSVLASGYGVSGIITGTVTRYTPDARHTVYFKNEAGEIISEVFFGNARVGVSAKVIDGKSGDVVWSDNFDYSGFEIDTAINVVVDVLMRRLKSGIR